MLSLSPRPRTPNLKAANPKKDLLASSLCIFFFFSSFFLCGCSPFIIMYLLLDQ